MGSDLVSLERLAGDGCLRREPSRTGRKTGYRLRPPENRIGMVGESGLLPCWYRIRIYLPVAVGSCTVMRSSHEGFSCTGTAGEIRISTLR